MDVVVPSSVKPGDQLTVVAPNGTQVVVTVPPNVSAGQTISVAYSSPTSVPQPPVYTQTQNPQQSSSPYAISLMSLNNNNNNNTRSQHQPPQQHSNRTMTVVVPYDVRPGDNMTVQAPDGTTVSVTIPPNTAGGSRITIGY